MNDTMSMGTTPTAGVPSAHAHAFPYRWLIYQEELCIAAHGPLVGRALHGAHGVPQRVPNGWGGNPHVIQPGVRYDGIPIRW